MTDPAGTAWFVFRELGCYLISCRGQAKIFTAQHGRLDAPPGFADVPRMTLELSNSEKQ